MLVYILRHGEAIPDLNGERHLTEEGSAQVKKVLIFAQQQFRIKVDSIISSPLLRARETAQLAARILGIEGYSVSNSLEPEGEPTKIYDELLRPNPQKRVLLVSHQPIVSRLLSNFVGTTSLAMPTGCIACVEVDALSHDGTLLFLIPPHLVKDN